MKEEIIMDTQTLQVTGTMLIFLAISIFLSLIVPAIAIVVMRRKFKGSFKTVFVGALTFILFALILEQISHYFFLVFDWPISQFIQNNAFAYALYGGLAAGIFEETGRYLSFKIILAKKKEKETSLLYGIGHGGIESIILTGVSLIGMFMVLLLVRSKGLDAYLATLPEVSSNAAKIQLESILSLPSYQLLLSGFERIFAITLHLSLSVLVFFSVHKKGQGYLFPIAIILHAMVNFPAALYQRGVISNILITEMIVFALCSIIAFFTFRFYKKTNIDKA